MSNLCHITITARGTGAAVSKLQKALPGLNPTRTRDQRHAANGFTPVCFNNFVPVPYLILTGEAGTLRDWLADKWGCGHSVGIEDATAVRQDLDTLVIKFSTRWIPPMGVIEAMSLQHPEVTLECSCRVDSTGDVSRSFLQAGTRREGQRHHASR